MRLFLTAVAVSVALPAVAQDITRQIPVDDTFIAGGIGLTQGVAPYEYRIKIIAANGVLEFCGAGAYTNAQVRQTIRRMLWGAELKMNGRTILEDFRFFSENRRQDLDSAQANCRSTGTPVPRSEVSFDIDMPRGRVR